jgi:CspA family cold shock protein
MATQLDRIESMLRALSAHLGVQSSERSGNGGPESPDVAGGARYTGVVSRFEHGWGFIECEAMNRNFFVHYSDIEGSGMRLLEPGEEVSFDLAPGKDGRPKAVRVRRQASNRSTPRPARFQGLPQVEADNGAEGEMPEGIEAAPKRSDLPRPERPPEQ